MNNRDHLKRVKVRTAKERCGALRRAIVALEARIASSPGTRHILQLIQEAAMKIDAFLDGSASDPDLDLLTDLEFETHIHRCTQLVPVLHWLVGLVERSDVTSVPAELAAPLRREIQRLFPNTRCELIVTSAPDLNYSIQPVSLEDLKATFAPLQLAFPEAFPQHIFVASLPSVEFDQALLHCIFAHELSHPLWEARRVGDRVFPIAVDESLFEDVVKRIQENSGEDLDAVRVRVKTRVRDVATAWSKELSSDLFALAFFGPAFLFALIHFLGSFQLLDTISASHPPPRMRLQALFALLDRSYDPPVFSETTNEVLQAWREISENSTTTSTDPFLQLTLNVFESIDLPRTLAVIVSELTSDNEQYKPEIYRRDVADLVPLINAHIPPAEVLTPTGRTPATFIGILNAGWETFLGGLDSFASRLPEAQSRAPEDVTQIFNGFLLKALELNESIASWRGVNK